MDDVNDRLRADEPVEIDDRMLHWDVDFEKGMNSWPNLSILLIVLCSVVFAFQFATGSLNALDDLIASGALHRESVMAGQIWRLLSATFMHANAGHLVGNLLMLYILGMANEHGYGCFQFLGLYVLSGIGGSLFSLLGAQVSVGASGAIFGLVGAIVVLFWRHRDKLHLRDRRIGLVLTIWASYQMFLGVLTPGVDNLAHAGGFLSGGLLGFVMQPAVLYGRQRVSGGWFAQGVMLLACTSLLGTAYFFVPRLVD